MKTDQEVNLARAQIGAGLHRLVLEDPDLDPKKRAALTGVYGALCWVLEIPNGPAAQVAAMLGGVKGDLLRPPQALDLGQLRPGAGGDS